VEKKCYGTVKAKSSSKEAGKGLESPEHVRLFGTVLYLAAHDLE
jgi:hypothetical protein